MILPRDLPPFSTGHAAQILGVHKRQLNKIVECGLVRVATTTGKGHRRVDAYDVLDLAARPLAGAPMPGDLALHLGPLIVDDNPENGRVYIGWHADAHDRGLTPQNIEDAWSGLWKIDPEPHIGAALVGDVAGFVVTLGTIAGHRSIAGRVRFLVDPPTSEIAARYAGRRFTARPGDVIQRLGPTS